MGVRTAHDGLAAVEAAETFLPHLRDALLIALTGYGDPDTRARSARAGFDSHMTKPADLDRLLPMLADPRARPRRDQPPGRPFTRG